MNHRTKHRRLRKLPLLFAGTDSSDAERSAPLRDAHQRIAFLSELVFELLVEVEALREAQIEAAKASGLRGRDTAYGRAWRRIVELSHNAAGPTGGVVKIFERWPEDARDGEYGGSPREASMLRRLGYDDDEIASFAQHLETLETYT